MDDKDSIKVIFMVMHIIFLKNVEKEYICITFQKNIKNGYA